MKFQSDRLAILCRRKATFALLYAWHRDQMNTAKQPQIFSVRVYFISGLKSWKVEAFACCYMVRGSLGPPCCFSVIFYVANFLGFQDRAEQRTLPQSHRSEM